MKSAGGGVIEQCQAQKLLTGSVSTVCSVGKDNDNKIYYSADTILVGNIIGKENHSKDSHNITNQEVANSDEGGVVQGLHRISEASSQFIAFYFTSY